MTQQLAACFVAMLLVACGEGDSPGGTRGQDDVPGPADTSDSSDTTDNDIPSDPPETPTDTDPPPRADQAITVSGARVLLDGHDFVSRGLILEGLLIPQKGVDQCLLDYPAIADKQAGELKNIRDYCVRHNDSRDYLYGRGVFAGGNDALTLAIQNWNANTVRFNVLQVALDPTSQYYSPEYLSEIVDAVALARAKKLVVILALFDAPANDDPYFSDRYPKLALNDAVTMAAAKTLAREFGDDPAVILELLNEPYLAKTAPDVRWRIWRDGGVVDYGKFAGHVFIGVNQIIHEIRASNAKNAIIVQPPSASFEGFPGGVIDPADAIIYSAHAFLVSGDDANRNWQLMFGEFARTHPFIMTAWGVDSAEPWCSLLGPDAAQQYLNSLQEKSVGVVGFALDVSYSIVRDFRKTFDQPAKISRTCEKGGGGEILQQLFNDELPLLANALPVISGFEQPALVLAGQSAAFEAHATDADAEPLNYRIDWGDGTASPSATAIQDVPSFSHTYPSAGAFSVSVEVVDARGARAMATYPVVVQ